MRKITLVVLLIVAEPLFAQWRADGKPVPDTSWRKSSGTFGVMLMLTDDPDRFMADWEKPDTPELKTTDVTRRGKTIAALVLFVGCKEKESSCNATVDFTVLRPDGSEYASQKDGELWKDKPAPGEGKMELSVANLGIRIEQKDPLGKYTVRAVAHDVNGDRTISVEQTFVVEK